MLNLEIDSNDIQFFLKLLKSFVGHHSSLYQGVPYSRVEVTILLITWVNFLCDFGNSEGFAWFQQLPATHYFYRNLSVTSVIVIAALPVQKYLKCFFYECRSFVVVVVVVNVTVREIFCLKCTCLIEKNQMSNRLLVLGLRHNIAIFWS